MWQRTEETVSDRTLGESGRPVMSGGLLKVTGRWSPVSGRNPTDVSGRSWNLTGSDRTLGSCVRSWHCATSGHHLTVGIGRSVFEERDDVAAIR